MAPATAAIGPQPTAPIELLDELPNNPRAHWGDMDGLAASVREKGVLEPLLVRPRLEGRLQVIAGARRLRAAKLAGLAEVPVSLLDVGDTEALELALIENLQRHDVHRLNEALGLEALMQADPIYTVDALSTRLGKPARYIRETLKLLNLNAYVRKAYGAGEILDGHAVLLAGLPSERQREGLRECYFPMWQSGGDKQALRPVKALETWIHDTEPLDLAAPETKELFPEAVQAAAPGSVTPVVQVHHGYDDVKRKGAEVILGARHWWKAAAKDDCAKTAVMVLGRERGAVVRVCIDADCAKHFPKPKATPSATRTPSTPAAKAAKKAAETREANRREAERRKRAHRDQVRARAMEAAASPATEIAGVTLRMLFEDMTEHMDLPDGPAGEAFTRVTGLAVKNWHVLGDVGAATEEQLVKGIVFLVLQATSYNDKRFAGALKSLKVDLKKIEAAVTAEAKAAEKQAKADAAAKAKADAKKKAPAKTKAAKKR